MAVTDRATCKDAANFLHKTDNSNQGYRHEDHPKYCILREDILEGVWFNTHSTGARSNEAQQICKK